MASENFRLKVFTPVGLVLDEMTSEVRLPSVDGEICILPHFTKYAGLLGTGSLLYATPKGLERMQVSGGLIQFASDTLTVLADRVGEVQ